MPDLYQKRQTVNGKDAQQEARRAMQKNQLRIIDEDGKLRRREHDLEMKKKELEQAKKNIEKFDTEISNLQRKEVDAEKDIITIERDITLQKNIIKKLEYDSEKFREEAYRRDRSGDI
jgi:chromosome segregation ATPase